MKLDILKFGD